MWCDESARKYHIKFFLSSSKYHSQSHTLPLSLFLSFSLFSFSRICSVQQQQQLPKIKLRESYTHWAKIWYHKSSSNSIAIIHIIRSTIYPYTDTSFETRLNRNQLIAECAQYELSHRHRHRRHRRHFRSSTCFNDWSVFTSTRFLVMRFFEQKKFVAKRCCCCWFLFIFNSWDIYANPDTKMYIY